MPESLWQRYPDWLYYHDGLGLYKIARHLAANDRGITLEGDRARPTSLKVWLQ